ncbi:helix-turn-helix domain-containing protein [Desulfobulbus alkaliphilus]|uniref:helix-turn-helix domain-containing protein n=1 Tax=Desulfobulbus alkaliphilus TaxID=869814 RepID=UPI001962A9E5|nr:helix-turn-helix transcriptional regulator [Desulfobulbus alkaliphilus]MBM9536305.1 helix-turn-helix transcriptional regulator [Desulfobulbus alkaliphilus]
MNVHIDVQIIKDSSGKPTFAVVPYERWVKQTSITAGMIPNEVVGAVIMEGKTPVRAWREHLGFTQDELAAKAGMTQAALSQIESGEHKTRKATLEKLALAMGITESMLR